MRFDNPIHDHWMTLPDIAAFPEYSEEDRNDERCDLASMKEAFIRGDWSKFEEILNLHIPVDSQWVSRLYNYFNIYGAYHRNGYPRSQSIVDNDAHRDLYLDGIHITRLDLDGLNYQHIIDGLLNQPDWKPEPGTYDRGVFLEPVEVKKIHEKLRVSGLLDAASAYSGKWRKVTGAYLHVSMPTDYHYKQFMSDATIVPRWINTHIDPKENVMKAIIYLEDVGEANGGFGYVPESNRFIYDPLQEIFGRAISTGNYCRTPEMRQEIFGLPEELRVSYNFGRCVLDDSEIARHLDDNFVRVTSDMGNVMVFDAGAGMHQGGIVKEGRRVSIQVLMK